MNPLSSVFMNDSISSGEDTLVSIFKPIFHELEKTRALYKKTILDSAEKNYIHNLILESGSYTPNEFKVGVVSKISNHLLQSEGKWIRAALVLLSAGASGAQNLSVRQVSVAVELIHLATLIHDDIIDEAPTRRGISSVPGGWGNTVAVLMGDFLFSKAFKLLLASGSVPAQTLMTKATGQMCLGEIKQLRYSLLHSMDEKEYLEMIENKTASLMASATASGAHLGGLTEDLIECFHAFGHAIGMAFQITDDVLDYTSSSQVLGKEQGGDVRNGKVTLPLIHLLQNNGKIARSIFDGSDTIEIKTKNLLSLMNDLGSIEYAYSIGRKYGEAADENLQKIEQAVGQTDYSISLHQLIDFILKRNK